MVAWRGLEARRRRSIVWRTGFLAAATLVLLDRARSGQSFLVLAVCFTTYIVAATLWIRGQYAAWLKYDGVLWTPPAKVSGPVVAVAVAAVVAGFWTKSGTLIVFGLVSAYFFAGYLVMRIREVNAGSRKPMCALLLLLAVAGVGVGFLDQTYLRWLALALVLVPVPASVLAEQAIHALRGQPGDWSSGPRGRYGWRAAARWLRWHPWFPGGVLLVVGAAWALSRVDGSWMVAAVVVLALLMLAMVSNTYADIAAVIALIALLGVTPQQEHKPRDWEVADDDRRVLVSLGDSYMSGEGAKVYYDGTDDTNGDGNHCRRAPTSWAAMAGQREPFDGFVFLACSGARTYNLNSTAEPVPAGGIEPEAQYESIGTQLDDYKAIRAEAEFKPALVVVSLGGNDAGFSTIGAMCLAPGNCGEGGEEIWLPKLPAVEHQLRATFDQIDDVFPSTPVAVVGYPDPIYTQETSGDLAPDCSRVALSKDDRDFVESLLTELNARVEAAATAAGFYYIDGMVGALGNAQLQLCDPRNGTRPGLNFIGLRSVGGFAEERYNPGNWYHNSLHPNERGHAAMLEAFETWLGPYVVKKRGGEFKLRLPTVPEGRVRGEAVATEPREVALASITENEEVCALYEKHDGLEECTDEGSAWVAGEVHNALVGRLWAVIYLLIAAGAWLLSVSLLAWRHKVAQSDRLGQEHA